MWINAISSKMDISPNLWETVHTNVFQCKLNLGVIVDHSFENHNYMHLFYHDKFKWTIYLIRGGPLLHALLYWIERIFVGVFWDDPYLWLSCPCHDGILPCQLQKYLVCLPFVWNISPPTPTPPPLLPSPLTSQPGFFSSIKC